MPRTGSHSVSIESPDLAQFGATLANSLPIFLQEFEQGMTQALIVLQGEIQSRTPVNSGFLRASEGYKLYGDNTAIHGEVFSIATYAAPVEYGRAPGKWPPRDQIELWVRRKLGITNDREAASAAFLIARAIGRRGTVGSYMFQRGLSAAERMIEQIFDASVDRAMARLAQ